MENRMKVEFSAVAENEAFARAVSAAFIMPLDPTVEELTEIKTAVSEAVSNSIIHGYADSEGEKTITMECMVHSSGKVVLMVEDKGVGIEDVEKAMEPLFSTGDSEERSGMGFTVMESFMDKLKVKSENGKGTTVTMTKYLDVVSGI
ncbi:MAG: anti-sigma F factor [Clostridiales bacterium]|nr:anti-sigma F factor [Clostridiales bacterium]